MAGANRAGYRTPVLLSGLVVLGWSADALLLGGAAHWPGWLLALMLVGGITWLSARASSKLNGSQTTEGSELKRGRPSEKSPMPTPQSWPIRPPRSDELAVLIEVEVAADQLFPLAGYGETPGPATLDDLRGSPLTLVAGDPPVGYVRVDVVDGRAHIESLSVRPRFMRRGIGRALVLAACDWAAEQGYPEVTLCTFAEVPWNAPFYAKLGFVELTELTPGLERLRETERRMKLDEMGRRVVMVRPAGTLDR